MKDNEEHLTLKIGNKTVPLAFVEINSSFYVISSGNSNRWPGEVLRQGSARISLHGEDILVTPKLVTDSDQQKKIKDTMIAKYGDLKFNKWFAEISRIIKLSQTNEVNEKNMDHYEEWLKDEFDSIAQHYDHHIYDNLVNNYLRERSISLMKTFFPPSQRLMEIGSGTGTETLEMLKSGHEITAIDISENMNSILRKKAIDAEVSDLLTTITMKASDLVNHEKGFMNKPFDGLYSNYGALNCESNIDAIMESVHKIVKPHGKVVLGIFNKFCILELTAHMIGMKPRRVFERFSNKIPEGASRFCIDVYPYSPAYLKRLFSKRFNIEMIYGCPVILPPSNYSFMIKGRINEERIKKADMFFSKLWPFNYMGDHTLYFMRNKN